MKNYQIISLDEQLDPDYDEELEKGTLFQNSLKFLI